MTKIIEKHTKDMGKKQSTTNRYLRELINITKKGGGGGGGRAVGGGKTPKPSDTVKNWPKMEPVQTSGIIKHAAEIYRKSMKYLNEKIFKPTYETMKHLKDTVVSHVKDAMQRVGTYFKDHMKTILEPISEIAGPLIAVSKSLFGFSKAALFGKKKKQDEKNADNVQGIYDRLTEWFDYVRKKGSLKDEKPQGFMRYLVPVAALLIGFFTGLFDTMGVLFKPIKAFGKMIMNLKFIKDLSFMKKFFGFFDKLKFFISKSPIAKILGTLGKIAGKLFMPLMMLWDLVSKWPDGATIRDRILFVSATIFDTILQLPEWLANTFMSMFTDFKVDFSAEAIIGAVNNLTTWVFDSITVPIMDFFTITLPKAFESVKDTLSSALSNPLDFSIMLKDQIIDMLIGLLGDVPLIGDYVKDLANLKSTPTVGGAGVTKNTSTLSTANTSGARAGAANLQNGRATIAAVEAGNANAGQPQPIVVEVNNSNDEIPTDPEAYGLLMANKSYGMGG